MIGRTELAFAVLTCEPVAALAAAAAAKVEETAVCSSNGGKSKMIHIIQCSAWDANMYASCVYAMNAHLNQAILLLKVQT